MVFELVNTLTNSAFLKELWNLATINFGIQRNKNIGMKKNKAQTQNFLHFL